MVFNACSNCTILNYVFKLMPWLGLILFRPGDTRSRLPPGLAPFFLFIICQIGERKIFRTFLASNLAVAQWKSACLTSARSWVQIPLGVRIFLLFPSFPDFLQQWSVLNQVTQEGASLLVKWMPSHAAKGQTGSILSKNALILKVFFNIVTRP